MDAIHGTHHLPALLSTKAMEPTPEVAYRTPIISIAGGGHNFTNDRQFDDGDNNDSFTNVNMPLPFPDEFGGVQA